MVNCTHGLVQIGRRDFIRTTAIAGVAGAIPTVSALAQEAPGPVRPAYTGKQRKVLLLSSNPEAHGSLIQAFKGIKEFDVAV